MLNNCNFVFTSTTTNDEVEKLKTLIKNNNGKIQLTVNSKTTHVIHNSNKAAEINNLLKQALEKRLPYLEDIQSWVD